MTPRMHPTSKSPCGRRFTDPFMHDCSPALARRPRVLFVLPLALLAIVHIKAAAPPALAQEAAGKAAHEAPPDVVPSTVPQPSQTLSQDCFDELENGSGPLLACRMALRLSPSEQAELEKGSRSYVKNVSCMLTIEIRRDTLRAPIETADYVFESPEQPVTCSVTTYKTTFDVTATFAPRIVFKGNAAVEA